MSVESIKKPDSVRAAVAECDQLGRELFLRKYGFGHARDYYLLLDGRRYDSKAILGAAHGYEFHQLGPLRADQFSGGVKTVVRKLQELGFDVENVGSHIGDTNLVAKKVSDLLRIGSIYTREALKGILPTQDATINNGVFPPAGFSSVLIFVTRDKTKDRTQYVDLLDGDVLRWQGQSQGRTDKLIIEHHSRGNELLVFYRESKNEHDGAGFRYEGPFSYLSHEGNKPANFVLARKLTDNRMSEQETKAEASDAFNPSDIDDARERQMAAIVRRRGQPAFRRALMRAYGGRCAITGCGLEQVLEAAHIFPYQGPKTNHVTNGILLRADLHTLFDLDLIAIDPVEKLIIVAPALQATEYARWNGKRLSLPDLVVDHPCEEALRLHRKDCAF